MGKEEVDVLIVGAGPTGLTLALELAVQGVTYRIVDKAPERSDKSRALVVHPRTQELLNRHGDCHELINRSNRLRGLTWFMGPKHTPHFDFDTLKMTDTEFPVTLSVSQVETERYLDACLAKKAGDKHCGVEWGMAAESIVQDGKGVTVTLSRSNNNNQDSNSNNDSPKNAHEEKETVRCRYVVGCDGSHSVVRHSAKAIGFPGAAYPNDFILCDARLTDTTIPLNRIAVVLGSSMLGVFPLGGDVVRLASVRVNEADNIHPGPGEDVVEPTLAEFQAILDKMVSPVLPADSKAGTLTDPIWMCRYRLHHRCATSYRDGRLLLAGDAAHIHSPLGGQGMNTSIQDAVNLGWKLAAVVRGRKPDSFLDTYTEERRPIGRTLIKTTDNAFKFLSVRNRLLVWLRNFLLSRILPIVIRDPDRRRRLYSGIAEFTVNYRRSSIVGTGRGFSGPVRGGDRLSDGKLILATHGGGGGEGGQRRESTTKVTIQQLCVGTGHRLLIFAGGAGGCTAASEEGLAKATADLTAVRDDVPVSTIFAGDKAPPEVSGSLLDPNGTLHKQYGFKKPGYMLVRPDSYVAHIGYLSNTDGLVSALKAC